MSGTPSLLSSSDSRIPGHRFGTSLALERRSSVFGIFLALYFRTSVAFFPLPSVEAVLSLDLEEHIHKLRRISLFGSLEFTIFFVPGYDALQFSTLFAY